ncbi:MAG: outer membrane beta-barrel protein [Betaproteobacteria bacterium]
MKKLALAGIVSALISSGAFAADNGPFVEAAIGASKFNVDNSSGWNMSKNDTSWNILGGYMVNKYVGLEAGYLDLGKVSGSISGNLSGNLYGKPLVVNGAVNASGTAKGWLLGVRGVLPINEQFSLNARAGVYLWNSDLNASVSAAGTWGGSAIAANGSASKSYTGSDAYYGIGAKYNVNKQVAIGLGYAKYKLGGDLSTNVDNYDLNVSYSF